MGVAPTAPMRPLANVSTSNLAYNIPNYLCANFGAFIKKCTIDQLIRSTSIIESYCVHCVTSYSLIICKHIKFREKNDMHVNS